MAGKQLINTSSSLDSGFNTSFDDFDRDINHDPVIAVAKAGAIRIFDELQDGWVKKEEEIRRLRQENLVKNKRIQQMGTEIDQHQDRIQQLTSEGASVKESLEKEKTQRKTLYDELQRKVNENEELRETGEKNRKERDAVLPKMQDLSKENEALRAALRESEYKRERMEDNLSKTATELNNSRKELDLASSNVQKLRGEKLNVTSEFQDERAEKEEAQQALQKLQKHKEKISLQMQELETEKENLQASLESANATLDEARGNISQMKRSIAELETGKKELEDQRVSLETALNEKTKDADDKTTQLHELSQKLKDTTKQLESVRRKKNRNADEITMIRTQLQDVLENEDDRTSKADQTLSEANATTLKCIELAHKGIESSKERKITLIEMKKLLDQSAAKMNATLTGDKRNNLTTLRTLVGSLAKANISTEQQLKKYYWGNIRHRYNRMVDDLGYHLDSASGQDLLDTLYQDAVIEETELDALRNIGQKPERARKFLDVLKSKNVKVFKRFIKILKQDSHREHLASVIEGTQHPALSDEMDTDSEESDRCDSEDASQAVKQVTSVHRAETMI